MLFKVLIVDDDMVTRTGLSTLLDWERNGYELTGCAVNGENALQMIEINPPDMVITDMSMPVMDGLALIECLERRYPYIKIIALSGYDDFDYVRQSMKKGAVDYLLKHRLTPELLLAALDAARQRIDAEQKERAYRHHTQEQLASVKEMMTREFIRKLTSGELTDLNDIRGDIKLLGLKMDVNNLVAVSAEIDDYSFIKDRCNGAEIGKLTKAFIEIARNILDGCERTFVGDIGEGAFIILFSFGEISSSAYIHNQVNSAIERIKTSVKRYLNITACFGISNLCGHISELNRYYGEARKMLKIRFYEGKDRILWQGSGEKQQERYYSLDLRDEKNLILHIKSFEKEKVHEEVESIFRQIQHEKVEYQSVQILAAELYNMAGKIAREAGVDFSEYARDIPFKTLQKYDTAADIKHWILKIFDRLIEALLSGKPDGNYGEITKKAVAFIHSNYRKSISLNNAAEYAGVSSSYLSHIFKEDTGKGFVEYLNSFRVEKARMLIENGGAGLKAIVGELGFSSYNYFFKVFKEFAGMTPLEYEESCREKTEN